MVNSFFLLKVILIFQFYQKYIVCNRNILLENFNLAQFIFELKCSFKNIFEISLKNVLKPKSTSMTKLCDRLGIQSILWQYYISIRQQLACLRLLF